MAAATTDPVYSADAWAQSRADGEAAQQPADVSSSSASGGAAGASQQQGGEPTPGDRSRTRAPGASGRTQEQTYYDISDTEANGAIWAYDITLQKWRWVKASEFLIGLNDFMEDLMKAILNQND